MAIWGVPEATIEDLSRANVVQSYVVMIDTNQNGAVWKLLYKDGRSDVLYLPSVAARGFIENVRRTQEQFRWEPNEKWPSNQPTLTHEDLDFNNNPFGQMTGTAVLAHQDRLTVTFQFISGRMLCVRIRRIYAMQLAQLHQEGLDAGYLRDVQSESPPTPSRH